MRIPKLILDQIDLGIFLGEEVELEAEADRIVIRKIHAVRAGWDDQFQLMAAYGDDQLLDDVILENEWDDTEWEW
ncbi:MAG: AbrB/MazE/SpoVT family DNA-binding domain-containing protein [Sphaerospermopsis sp. SIO1G2]|nr:AbrB/MazE/SpoVT family DNA-binding domain-containing protein [Sphaerospermopsis sp. SIO1G2]